jgi:hypothetical protein
MELTGEHLAVAYGAWSAAQTGGGVVVEDPGLLPAAVELGEQGWLRRKFVDDRLAWFWTPAAETALAIATMLDATGREN